MSIIKDGKGTGNTLQITTENKAQVDAVERSLTQHINEVYEKHFSLTFEAIDPTTSDDYFFYFKNTGTKNIHFTKFRFKSTVIGTVEIHAVTGTASAVTDVAPANRFIGSTNTITDSTGTSVDFTGLTSVAALIRLTLDIADKDYVDDAPSHIIVPPGQAIACLWDQTTGILAGTLDIYEDQGV